MKKSELLEALAGVPDDEEIIVLLYKRNDYLDPAEWFSNEEDSTFSVPGLSVWNEFVPWFEKSAEMLKEEVGTFVGDQLLDYYGEELLDQHRQGR